MPQTLEAMNRQMDSLGSIHSIVHTMKTLSVVNAAPYEEAARAIEAYHDTVLEGLHAFFAVTGPVKAGFKKDAIRVLIVFGSDHGLCGNYNEATVAHVAKHLFPDGQDDTIILCVGAQMLDALSDRALDVGATFLPAASADGLGRLANLLTRRLDLVRQDTGASDIVVNLAYMMRDTDGQRPCIQRLLPLDADLLAKLGVAPWRSRSRPTFHMQAPDLLRALIENHVFAGLVRAAAEAMLTENAARLALMSQAETSVEDRIDALTAQTNALRQDAITTELLDVIIGFEALKKRPKSGSGLVSNTGDEQSI